MLDKIATINDIDLHQKCVLIREDFNVPMQHGKITDDERIKRALPTLQLALDANAAVIIVSHLGRPPNPSVVDKNYSLAPVANHLSQLLGRTVTLKSDWQTQNCRPAAGEVVLLENIRFNQGETDNDTALAKQLAGLCDVFVMDAFGSAHRAHASTVGVAEFAPKAVAGPLLIDELSALSQSLHHPKHPLVAVVGGSKVSSKIHVLSALLHKVDTLIVGGGIANTFLKAKGLAIGKSLYEADWISQAESLLDKASLIGVNIPLPEDVIVAEAIDRPETAKLKSVLDIADNEAIFDVGIETQKSYSDLFRQASTIVWNGPVGVFEIAQFSHGTKAMAEAIAASRGFSLAGGGDTLAAISQFGLANQINYLSTGGGAFLEYLEGKELPALAVLKKRYQQAMNE